MLGVLLVNAIIIVDRSTYEISLNYLYQHCTDTVHRFSPLDFYPLFLL